MKAKIRYMRVLTVLYDILAGMIAFTLAAVLENHSNHWDFNLGLIPFGFASIIITLISMKIFNCYRVVWRFASVPELVNFAIAFCVSFIVNILLEFVIFKHWPVSLPILFQLFFFFFALFIRFNKKIVFVLKRTFGDKSDVPLENIIIYGAGFTGAALIKRFLDNPKDGYNPVAIIDDNPEKLKKQISGIRVVGGRETIKDTMYKFKAKSVAIAITEINREELRAIYSYLKKYNAEIKVVNNLGGAETKLNSDAISLKGINIEDLLRRNEHIMDKELINQLIKDKTVMVTGGCGSIGSEVCRQALIYGCKHLIIFDQHENGMFEINEEFCKKYAPDRYTLVVGNIRDKIKLKTTMDAHRPDIVFHAAAYKHVPMMEINADEAVKNNIFGTRNVIEQCQDSGVARYIQISTDKAVNPANVMGATKRMAELILESKAHGSKTVLAAVRFGNVLGSSGSVIPTFIKQINQGGPVTVTHKEMQRYFMTIPEAVRLVMQAGALASGGEVFVLDMGEPVFIYDLACDLVKLSGLEPERDIRIEITGLRPGEKLFEELRFSNEDVDQTKHSGIFVCKLEKVDNVKLKNTLIKLTNASEKGENHKVEDALFDMIPSIYRK